MHDRRNHERIELEALSARMLVKKDHREIDYFPINISKSGFSIFINHPLEKDDVVVLELNPHMVDLIVVWCTPKPEDPALYRCGLEVADPKIVFDDMIREYLKS